MKKILTLLILAGAAHLHGAAETANLYETNPTKADELLATLKNDIQRGRSTDGLEAPDATRGVERPDRRRLLEMFLRQAIWNC